MWHTKKIRAKHVLEHRAKYLHETLTQKRLNDKGRGIENPRVTLTMIKSVRDRTDAIWYDREREQDARQAGRDRFVKRYRPILTLRDSG